VTIRAGDNLKALLARVTRASAAHGKKTELAKFLGVSPQRVTNWLSLDRAPNGEITLLMQQWVIAQETNKNAPGSASNTARSKARSTRNYYETRKTSPRRK
jgi:hypothetical protein